MQVKLNYLLSLAAGTTLLVSTLAMAQTTDDLKRDRGDGNVLTYGLGYGQQRYSTLDQIDKRNVSKLAPVWALSLENDFGEQAQPMVKDGVMYVSDAKWTTAINAITGKQLWRVATEFDPETPRVVCCGVSSRGVALADGLVMRGTLDAYMVALDQKTGKEVWKTKVIDWKEGYSITGAPLAVDGVVMTGIAGGEFGIRGFIDGYDVKTGKRLWRRYTTAAPGEKGGDTWPVVDSYKNGGGSTWTTGSYDPELNLVYWGVGNAGPYQPSYRGGDSLFTTSVIALRPQTGEIVWHYQFVPNEMYDYDAISEMILGDVKVDGTVRKGLMHMNKNGFAYVLDRTNGKLLAANKFAKANWASHVDMATGRPVETELAKNLREGKQVTLWPSLVGAKNWQHAAFNPTTGLLYANTIHMGYSYSLKSDLGTYKPGGRWQGHQNFKYEYEEGAPRGHIEAIDPVTGKAKWRVPLKDYANFSSMLATSTGLLFTGRQSGEFIALDADNGKQLWQFQTSSGINATPITWSYQGKQYVTVLVGTGGVGRRFMDETAKNLPNGGSAWTFALPN